MGPTRNASAASLEHVQVLKVLAGAGNLALQQERAGVTHYHFRCPNLNAVAVAEDVTHHMPQVLLSIPVLPLKLLHALLNRLLALSLHPMDGVLHPCPKAIQAASYPLRAAYAYTTLSIEDHPPVGGDCGLRYPFWHLGFSLKLEGKLGDKWIQGSRTCSQSRIGKWRWRRLNVNSLTDVRLHTQEHGSGRSKHSDKKH